MLVAHASALFSQPPPPRAAFTESVAVRWVLVPVVVWTTAGHLSQLEQEEFRLEVDGRSVQIETFENRVEAPISLVYLQDLSGSMALGDKLVLSRGALSRLLERSAGGDEVAIVTFSGDRIEVRPFTADHTEARELMATWRAFGTTGLHDAVSWLPEVSIDSRQGRRAAVVVTDGIDNASIIDPTRARDMVRRTELPVYVLDLGACSRSAGAAEGNILEALATGTGGLYFAPGQTLSDVIVAADSVASDLRHQYVLGFPTQDGAEAAAHRIVVEVRGGKRRVRHRPDYFGPPPLDFGGLPGPAQ